ncbi:hypothetical protein LSAT2_004649 [Lamellibrachia satsuma]|nr:hypothetical protein LSAT2_004649 [Lamellibrachia satsuma]
MRWVKQVSRRRISSRWLSNGTGGSHEENYRSRASQGIAYTGMRSGTRHSASSRIMMHTYCVCLVSAILLGNMIEVVTAGSMVGCYKDILVCFVDNTGISSLTFSSSMSKETLTKICNNKEKLLPCLHQIPKKCSAIVQNIKTTSLDRCYLPICLDKYESCSFKITGIEMPTDPDESIPDLSLEQQIDMCRSVSLMKECMESVQKECARAQMSPTKHFTRTARCHEVCLDKYEWCTLNITGIVMPTGPDEASMDMTIEQQIDVCRSVSLVEECMEPVQKECAKYNKLSPTREFTKVARCDQVTEDDVCRLYNETDFCENGGYCVAIDFYPVCECEFGFTGNRCEVLNCTVIMELGNFTTLPDVCLTSDVSVLNFNRTLLSATLISAVLMIMAVLQ